MVEKTLEKLKQDMKKSLKIFEGEIVSLRSTRLSSSLIEEIKVDYYNNLLPLREVATVSCPQPNLAVIKPWDKNIISQIGKAIDESQKDLSWTTDGETIKISFPPLSEEARKNLIKTLGERAEKERIVLRNLRREALEKIEEAKKNGEIGEDEMYRGKNKLDELISKFNKEIEEIVRKKEEEIMEV